MESSLWIIVLTQSYSLLIPKIRMQNNITEGDDKEYFFFFFGELWKNFTSVLVTEESKPGILFIFQGKESLHLLHGLKHLVIHNILQYWYWKIVARLAFFLSYEEGIKFQSTSWRWLCECHCKSNTLTCFLMTELLKFQKEDICLALVT